MVTFGPEFKIYSCHQDSTIKMDGGFSPTASGLKLTSQSIIDASLISNAQLLMELRDAVVLTQIPTIEDAWPRARTRSLKPSDQSHSSHNAQNKIPPTLLQKMLLMISPPLLWLRPMKNSIPSPPINLLMPRQMLGMTL